MPPKAKAKGKARPKAKVRVRPAAVAAGAGGVRRRPAAHVPPPPAATKKLCEVPLAELTKLGLIAIPKALHYHKEVAIAGTPKTVKLENGEIFLELETSGTQDDELLRVLSGKSSRLLQVHICEDGCAGTLTGETLVHGREFLKVKKEDDEWYSNLEKVVPGVDEGEDQLELLRKAALAREEKDDKDTEKDKKKSKTKKKKKDKKDKGSDAPSGSKGHKEKKKRKSESEDEEEKLEVGQRNLKGLFYKTGLDPNVKRRLKMMKKARKLGTAKKKKSKKDKSSTSSPSDGSDSSESSTGGGVESGLFDSDNTVKVMAKRYPGCLTCSSVMEAKESLITTSGMAWSMDKDALPPLYTHFTRQQLGPNMSPPVLQEALTISASVDALLQGRVAYACDILSQRLKALECLSRGAHWTVGRQLELVSTEALTMAEDTEALQAARRAKEQERLKGLLSRPTQPKGVDYDYGQGKKGKQGKGNGKGKSGDGGRGKGGDKNRGEKDQPWREKQKEKKE